MRRNWRDIGIYWLICRKGRGDGRITLILTFDFSEFLDPGELGQSEETFPVDQGNVLGKEETWPRKPPLWQAKLEYLEQGNSRAES